MITPKELRDCELQHHCAGGPLVMVQDIDAEYCRVEWLGINFGSNAYLAYKPFLVPMMKGEPDDRKQVRISDAFRSKVDELRKDLESGRVIVRQQRLVTA